VAICPSCYSFQDDGRELCSKCGQPLDRNQGLVGLELLEAVEPPRDTLRPAELLLVIAAIPVVLGLTRAAFGAETVGESFGLQYLLPIIGGLGLGGLARMLWKRGRGYRPADLTSWWVAGLGAPLVTVPWLVLQLLDRQRAGTTILVIAITVHGLACLPGIIRFLADFRERRFGVGPAGGLVCLLWVVGYLTQAVLAGLGV
jgi:hypothetical protein